MPLPRLDITANQIVNSETGVRVFLRGLNRSGMEYSGAQGIQWTESEFDRMILDWGANILRIPFNQEWALAREDYDPVPYLESLDSAIALATQRGAYTVLTLQWLDDHTIRGYDQHGRPNFVPPLPDEASAELWRQIAARYCGEPGVLYDILSEPHNVLPGDEAPPSLAPRVTMAVWQQWAKVLIEAIREADPTAVIFVSGVNWAYDLRGHPIVGVERIVYSTHVYRNKGSDWDEAFGNLAASVPVIASEWGGVDADIAWGERLADYLADRRIGWMAWGWPDWPPLIERDYSPTRFGALVQSRLRAR